jgi:hypothetical protein
MIFAKISEEIYCVKTIHDIEILRKPVLRKVFEDSLDISLFVLQFQSECEATIIIISGRISLVLILGRTIAFAKDNLVKILFK